MKKTKNRIKILDALQSKKQLLTVKQISTLLPEMDSVSIYRALDYLVDEEIITKISIANESHFEYQENPHIHAVCDSCSKIFHLEFPQSKIKKSVNDQTNGFITKDIQVVVTGQCSSH